MTRKKKELGESPSNRFGCAMVDTPIGRRPAEFARGDVDAYARRARSYTIPRADALAIAARLPNARIVRAHASADAAGYVTVYPDDPRAAACAEWLLARGYP